MNEIIVKRMELQNNLNLALERDEFILYYQPKVDLSSLRIKGVEALMRWQSPSGRLVPPDEVIPLAEETGLIIPIGQTVLQKACRQAVLWHEMGFDWLQLAVNLSPRQFSDPNLLEMVRKVISDTRLDPHFLELEITENAVMHNVDNAVKSLKQMTEMGISLSMDDFGMGYSSLANLHSFPLDVLKIDKSFVMRIGEDPGAKAIVKTIISMGQSLGLQVVAEGVENLEQAKFLKAQGCDQIQGYYISRPVDHDNLTELLKKQDKDKTILNNLG